MIAYKKINNIKGHKIAKLRFKLELENDIIKTIVLSVVEPLQKQRICLIQANGFEQISSGALRPVGFIKIKLIR